jgi:hypothetical protein
MAIKVCEKSIDFIATSYNKQSPSVRAFPPPPKKEEGERRLHCIVALMGETAPLVSPLSPNYGIADDMHPFRFDWTFGVSDHPDDSWDWQADLRETSAMVIQLLITTAGSGVGYTELASSLLALQPTKNTQTLIESHAEKLGTAMMSIAGASEGLQALPGAGAVAAALKTSAALATFVASGEGRGKNWYVYRFVDPKLHCACVEWKINKKVLLEYGPLLRGSLLLAFHGSPELGHPVKVELRPKLGFYKAGDLCHVTPTDVSQDVRVILDVTPLSNERGSASGS